MNYFEQHLNWFKTLTKPRQYSLFAGFFLIISLTSLLIYKVASPSYGVLFNHLDSRDASQLITQLDQANIAYQVRDQGREILIEKSLIDKTRIQLMGAHLALTHSVGFELFDKTDFGMTDFSQKINYQRALQGELERTINSLDEIKEARVHLVIPESHLFQEGNNQPRVAVTLHLNHPLSAAQVKSIAQLMTASVANLTVENVVIVDQNGNALTAKEEEPASNHFDAKKRVEHYLNEKVMQMLNRIFFDEGVLVKIDATLNYDELQRELVKPKAQGQITHEKETQHAIQINKTDKKPTNQDFTREKSYEFGHEKEHFTRANGTIQRLTISVVLPQSTNKEKRNQVERLVKSVVGFDETRGDVISVEALILDTAPATISHEKSTTHHAQWPKAFFYGGAMGLLILSVTSLVLHYRRRAIKRQQLLNELKEWLIEHA